MDTADIKVGDLIEFKSPTRHHCRKAQTERDAALYRLQALQVKLEAEMKRRGMQTPTQAQQARLGTDFCGAVEMVGIKKASAMMREVE